MADKLDSKEAYKQYKAELHQAMLQKQRVPYSIKRKMAESRNCLKRWPASIDLL